jgi:hypothetical protein
MIGSRHWSSFQPAWAETPREKSEALQMSGLNPSLLHISSISLN